MPDDNADTEHRWTYSLTEATVFLNNLMQYRVTHKDKRALNVMHSLQNDSMPIAAQ